jgi:hypothetical protein
MTATSSGVCVVKGTIPGGDNYQDSAATGSITVAKVLLDIEPTPGDFSFGQSFVTTYAITGLQGSDNVQSVTRTYLGVGATSYDQVLLLHQMLVLTRWHIQILFWLTQKIPTIRLATRIRQP